MNNYSKTSMLYWYPKVKDLVISMPRTEIIRVPYSTLVGLLDGHRLPGATEKALIEIGETIGYPLFLRTDMGSAKHHWRRTCYVPSAGELFEHICCLVDGTLAAGMFGELDPNALVLRELLQLNAPFTAFDGLPIGAERRYFVQDGEVKCHHFYWVEGAIEKSWIMPSSLNWRQYLAALNKESPEEIKLLTGYARIVSKAVPGYWSVDFAEGNDGKWYLIDMAEGEKSWHPECGERTTR